MEVVTYLRQLQPNQTKDTILQALKAFTTMTGMSEPMVQGLVWRVLEIVHTYATSKLKPDHPMQSKIYCNDAVAEMALESLSCVLQRNESLCTRHFWILFQHGLNLMCLTKSVAPNEVRLWTLRYTMHLLLHGKATSVILRQEALQDGERKSCIGLAVYKCFERIHEEHPKGEKNISKAAFQVLDLLMDVFNSPELWFGILPSATTELSAYLTQIGRMVDNRDAVLPATKLTVGAIHAFASLIVLVLDSRHYSTLQPFQNNLSLIDRLCQTVGSSENLPKKSEIKTTASEGRLICIRRNKATELIVSCLPALARHPSPHVRSELATSTFRILWNCSFALESCLNVLFKILLSLSLDSYTKVTSSCHPCITQLQKRMEDCKSEKDVLLWRRSIEFLMKEELFSLPDALRRSETECQTSARLLTALIELIGREAYVEEFLKDPFLLDAALKAWRLAFGFDSAQTRTLYQTYFHPTQLDWPQESAKTSFPKMPVALLYMTHEDTYKAISRWIQFTSQTAISFSPSLNVYKELVHGCMNALREEIESENESKSRCIASHICILSEILLGAAALPSTSLDALESIVIGLVKTFDNLKFWSSVETEDSLQAAGDDAVKIRCLLEWVCVCAKLFGERLRNSGCEIIQRVGMHVLERTADPCPFIQIAAKTTVDILCSSMKLEAVSDFLSEFGDYVVDGLCYRLRDEDQFPRAPFLLAAVFDGLEGNQMLNLISEPLSYALKGLSIQNRERKHPYGMPFLQALQNVAKFTQDASEAIRNRLENAFQDTTHTVSESKMLKMLQEVKHLESIARIAESLVQIASPLFLDARIQIALLALKTCGLSLKALRCTTESCQTFDFFARRCFPQDRNEVTFNIPKLNPTIGPVWKHLVTAMKTRRVAVIEGVAEFFTDVSTLFDGRLLSRRFSDEAWPILETLLRQGHSQPTRWKYVAHKGSFAFLPQSAEGLSTHSKHRGQLAVLLCLKTIGENVASRSCLETKLSEIIEAVFPLLFEGAMASAAMEALKSLALVDADLVWSVLMESKKEGVFVRRLFEYLETCDVAWHAKVRERFLQI